MRGIIIQKIFDLMSTREDIFFLTADMGINLVEKFEIAYPKRFSNVGIAEQNLISMAAGLCNAGYKPFVYSISNFLVHRCLEQVRNDIVMHNLPVVLVGTSTGYDNSSLGPTHHVVDDWGCLKSFPTIDIYCPSSEAYAERLVDKVVQQERPAYIRIPKNTPTNNIEDDDLVYISAKVKKHLFISYGGIASFASEVASKHDNVSLLQINKLHPLDDRILCEILPAYEHLTVIEEHHPNTGLYASICELLAANRMRLNVYSVAPKSYYFETGNSPSYFFDKFLPEIDQILSR